MQVFQVAYCKVTCRDELILVEEACEEFIKSVEAYNKKLLNRPKFHLLLHLPKCVEEFGGTASFNSER